MLGAEGHSVYEALNQLEQRDYFSARRSSQGAEFIHCRFVTPPWLKTPAQKADDEALYSLRREGRRRGHKSQKQPEQQASAEVVNISGGQERGSVHRRGSEFPLGVCWEWALHCQRRGDQFQRGIEYFAGWLYKFGGQDEDIQRWLRAHPRGREVALEFRIDLSANPKVS